MKTSTWTSLGCCAIGACVWLASLTAGQSVAPVPDGFMRLGVDDITFPEGVNQVRVVGDPGKPGFYVVRNRFAPGTGSRPHFHDQDRYVTVIKGTWWVALGPDSDVYDPGRMTPMKQGSFVKHPAGGHHYDAAKDEEVIVQIMGMGPVKSVQLGGAAQAPR